MFNVPNGVTEADAKRLLCGCLAFFFCLDGCCSAVAWRAVPVWL